MIFLSPALITEMIISIRLFQAAFLHFLIAFINF